MPQPPYVCDKDGCAAIADVDWGVATYREAGAVAFMAVYSVVCRVNTAFPEGVLIEYFCGPAHRLARISEVLAVKPKEENRESDGKR